MPEKLSQGEEAETVDAAEAVRAALVDLTANLLRVARGAGRPEDIERQASWLVAHLVRHRELAGGYDTFDFSAALDVGSDGGQPDERGSMVEQAIQGSLQILASRLLGQPMQVKAGSDELHSAFKRYAASSAVALKTSTQHEPGPSWP